MNEEMLDLEQENPEEKEPYVSSPRWKRVAAWVLFGVVCVGIVLWLLGIANPTWTDDAKLWMSELF